MKKLFILLFSFFLIASSNNLSFAVDRYISVSSTGTLKVKPDTVKLNATVFNIANSSKLALSNTSGASDKFRKVLAASGVKNQYIKTGTISVQPEYNYLQDKGSVLIGYRASQVFEVVIRNAASAGTIVDNAVNEIGENLTIDGTTPYIYDQTSILAEARVLAVRSAKSKALNYAKLLGVSLGKVISLDENSVSPTSNLPVAVAKSDAGKTIIDLGSQDISISILTKWAIL